MEAKAAAVSLSAPLPRCGNSLLACPAASARRSRRCRYHHGAPLISLARPSSSARSFPAGRVYAMAASAAPAKEQDLVFVAGATGKVGSRTVRELIKLGFRVRAGVRSKERASSLAQSVERLDLGQGTAAGSRLELVECDLEKQGEAGIAAAIGGAALVVCSIGASEKEILDVTGPYRIDYVATANLVRAAAAAGVEHFVLVTSLGTTRFGFPAALLNLFWGVLCWKKMAEEALVASGVPYTIVRPGGMERPTDAYKETHNLVVAPRDTYVGGLVSNLQVAELIACVAKNRTAAYCKVVEVVAETTAPLLPTEDLLARVPSDPGRAPPPAPPVVKESPPAAAVAQAPAPPPAAATPAPAAATPAPAPAPPAAAKSERPLSPYAAYEDLKPPSSPTPSFSSGTTTSQAVKESPPAPAPAPAAPASPPPPPPAAKQRPLSPFAAYEDLKPPSSPTPSRSSSKKKEDASPSPPPSAASPDAATSATAEAAAAPSSPPPLDSNANGAPTAPAATAADPGRPLSPYARYEDLKPPSTPTPSAPKV